MADAKAVHITRLIAIPAVITLAVTILRLVGELKHWPTPWFSTSAGGGGAIVGISWLPIVFGPYFALKLAAAGHKPASSGKAIGFAFLGLLAYFVAGVLVALTMKHLSPLTLVAFSLLLFAAFVPLFGWPTLTRALLAYALAARIPVLIVMYYAISGNGRAGWGTHYDAMDPRLAQLSFGWKYLYSAILPQLTAWIGWTVIIGAILGTVIAAIVYRGKPAASAAE
jgi:hypothetical protein